MVLLSGCGSPESTLTVDRVAFLNIDNLTGDDSLTWLTQAVPAMAAEQLAGVGQIMPQRGDTSRDAVALKANHRVHGYLDRRRGSLHFQFSIEDASTHDMRPVSVDGGVIEASAAISKAIDPKARAFSSTNLDAIRAWAERNYARAVELDPDFGAAWRDMAQLQASQKVSPKPSVTAALSRATLRTALDRAQLELLAAQLDNDPSRIAQVSKTLSQLLPNDSNLARALAQQESNARRFPEAIQLYERAIRLEPDDPGQYNGLGYTQFFAGDLLGARKSFDQYMKFPGQEANGLDSQGEVLFMAGQFKDAEQYFMKAHTANPSMLNGGDLLKAAYARWLGGDLTGADNTFKSYIDFRSQHADQAVTWRTAIWEYSTGRQPTAVARLKAATGPIAPTAQNQLLIWEKASSLPTDVQELQRQYSQTMPAADGLVRTLYARALKKVGKDPEAKQLTKLWPLPESGDPLLQAFVYPLFLELKNEK